MKTTTKVIKQSGVWHFTGVKYQGSCIDIEKLLNRAKAKGELVESIELNTLPVPSN